MSRFQIVASELVRQQMRQTIVRATLEGREKEVLAAYEQVVQRLSDDPLGFGEPRFHLHELGLAMRRGAVAPVLVNYGVNAEHRFVVIQAFDLMWP
jgi:hypothetical protein